MSEHNQTGPGSPEKISRDLKIYVQQEAEKGRNEAIKVLLFLLLLALGVSYFRVENIARNAAKDLMQERGVQRILDNMVEKAGPVLSK